MPAPRGRSKSAKKPSPLDLVKEEIEQKQIQIDALGNEINQLKELIQQQGVEEDRLTGKLHVILPEIIAHRDRDKYPIEPLNDVIDIDAGYVRLMIQQMIDDLHGRQSAKTLIEERLEELERRIIQQNTNYQKILRKNLACMSGIEEALRCSSAFEMKYVIRHLKQNLLIEDPVKPPVIEDYMDTQSDELESEQLLPVGEESPYSSPSKAFLISMETNPYDKLSMRMPIRKYRGDTHIRNLIPELKETLCNELSIERPNRGDWRHFAHLIGISTETIQFWRRLELSNPMLQVFNYWKDASSCDIRLLHRLLMNRQIKAYRLAKLIADFYDVD